MNIRSFALLLALGFCQLLTAQTAQSKDAADKEVRKATEVLIAKYQLNADQSKQVYTVLKRKHRNMAEIAPLMSTDRALYNNKCLQVQKSTLSGIRRVLNTKEQVTQFQKTQTDMRTLREAKRKEWSRKNVAREELDAVLLEIYAE